MESIRELVFQATAFVHDGLFVAASGGAASDKPSILWCNDRLSEILAMETADIVDAPLWDFLKVFRSKDGEEAKPINDGEISTYRLQKPLEGAAHRNLELELQALRAGEDDCRYWAGVVADLSERVQTKEKLDTIVKEAETARERLWEAVAALPDAFIMLDKDDRLIAFNAKFREFYAHSAPAIFEGAKFDDILRYGLANGQYPEAKGDEEAWLAERLDRTSRLSGPIHRQLPDNRHLIIHDIETHTGDIVGLRTDVTKFKLQQQALEDSTQALEKAIGEAEHAARTDSLTGLSNRRALDAYLKRLSDAEGSQKNVALIHIDLDRFKAINDVFGHAAGDHVLETVSEIMRSCLRPSDFVARVGGDEFVVVVSDYGDVQSSAEEISARIIEKCQNPVWFGEKELRFGASIGIAVAPMYDLIGLMENADIALYEAKGGGRNQYALFTPQLRAQIEQKQEVADELLKGISDDQIVAYFQPQVSCDDQGLVGLEALARWHHPTKGLVAPDVFLPVAEELGLLGEIDDIVLRKTFATVQNLINGGIQVPKVSVNVSYLRLRTNDFENRLLELKPWPCKLVIELLETIDFDQDADSFAWLLDGLREQGVEIVLDDFGSGRASITTLLRLQPDRIKIDRQLVAAVTEDSVEANPLVRAIAEMCKALGVKVSAEGVETEVQARVLRRLGCDVFQGHLFAPAMSTTDLRDWISNGAALQAFHTKLG